MRNHQTVVMQLPFAGFYNSHYSGEIDQEEESFVEYRTGEYDSSDGDHETYWPEALRIAAPDLQSMLFDVTQYRDAYSKMAECYVAAFDYLGGQAFGFTVADTRQRYNFETRKLNLEAYRRDSLHMTFESMDSPREYNFTTDRVYCKLPLAIVYLMFRKSRAEGHETLRTVIRDRFTSCDGFISHYSRDLADWLEKPLRDWDHNELETLLRATCQIVGFDCEDTDLAIYYATVENEGSYQAWESAVDWPKFDAKRAEKRAELLAGWLESDFEAATVWRAGNRADFDAIVKSEPNLFTAHQDALESQQLPYRCPETADMLANSMTQ